MLCADSYFELCLHGSMSCCDLMVSPYNILSIYKLIMYILCLPMKVFSTELKFTVANIVLNHLSNLCTGCSITDDIIVMQTFYCYSGSPMNVTYNATLEGTAVIGSTTLKSLVEEWVEVNMTVAGETMTVDLECFETDSLAVSESDCHSVNQNDGYISIAASAGGGIVIALLSVAVIIILVVVLKRRHHGSVHSKE